MRKVNYDIFGVRYFVSYGKWYISDGGNKFLNVKGKVGQVYYYSSADEATNALSNWQK